MGAWCGEDPRTTREKKQMDTEAMTGQTVYGPYLQEKQTFLSGNIILLTGAL
jgi:hypothetical protein